MKVRDVKGGVVWEGSRGMKVKRGLARGEGRRKKRAEAAGVGLMWFLRREKWGSVMRESQRLETDLNLRSDLMGRRRRRNSDKRSEEEAMI